MAGGFNTVKVAEALPVEPVFVPPFVDEINPLTFWCDPSTVPVTLTLTVHEPLAGIVAPIGDPKVNNVAPAVLFRSQSDDLSQFSGAGRRLCGEGAEVRSR
jgi:hypothetical protein